MGLSEIEFVLRKQNEILQKQTELLGSIVLLLMPERPAHSIGFITVINGRKTKVVHMFLKATDKLPLSLDIKDAFGNAAKVDGAPAWALTDDTLATIEVAEDGMSAVVAPVGPAGALKVQVKIDADLGEGVKEILGELDIEVLTGEAVSVTIVAGAPVPKEA